MISVVIPCYNEAKTIRQIVERVRAAPVPDKEILIVDDCSRDGTREAVLAYQSHPEVRVILEDRPQGKGHAVRTGFAAARGDIVMIQDADLEYDLNDYEGLLEPLLKHRALFVLGTRHLGHWKIRHFENQWLLTALMNFGHAFFTGLMNVLFRQRMTDPFTMFKVLRRDCLYGLEFECNRFDFDHELVIKLVRKGYRPLEIPVNYISRSFAQGKKVTLFRDPLSWLWVNLRLRFVPLYRRRPTVEEKKEETPR